MSPLVTQIGKDIITMAIKTIIFDAFGTLFKVANGGSAKSIMKNITQCGGVVGDLTGFKEVIRIMDGKHLC